MKAVNILLLFFTCAITGIAQNQELPDIRLKFESVPLMVMSSPELIGRKPVLEGGNDFEAPVPPNPAESGSPDIAGTQGYESLKFDWNKAMLQSLFFLGIKHGFRLLDPNQPDTRASLRGPFFKDWFRTVSQLRGWGDGDTFIINYIGHPLQGAISGRIQIQNDPRVKNLEIGYNKRYLYSRLKAMGFSAVYGLQFELGPISEASIGNASPGDYSPHPTSYVDLVITPVLGTVWLVVEDALDQYVIRRVESLSGNRFLVAAARSFLNPSRVMSNILRLKWPWYRDTR